MPDSLIDLAGLQVGAEQFLAAVLETTEQPIWIVDDDGAIRFANPAALAALGYERADELSGRNSHETIHYRRGRTPSRRAVPLLRPLATASRSRASSTGSSAATARRSRSPTSRSRSSSQDGRGAVVAVHRPRGPPARRRVLREHDAVLAAQQASLRRVATLVAGGAPRRPTCSPPSPGGRPRHRPPARRRVALRARRDGDRGRRLGRDRRTRSQVGTRWPLDGPTICAASGRPAAPRGSTTSRTIPGTIADAARDDAGSAPAPARRSSSTASSGARCRPTRPTPRRCPTTSRSGSSSSRSWSRRRSRPPRRQDELARLADEQAALRRVATLVAQGVPAAELFARRHRGGRAAARRRRRRDDPLRARRHRDRGRQLDGRGRGRRHRGRAAVAARRGEPRAADPERPGGPRASTTGATCPGPIADYVRTRLGLSSSVGSPILVEGRVWGNLAVHSTTGPLPRDTEERITRFTELVATAILNAQARADVQRLADEQAALRRVATLVARERQPAEVFAAVAEEVGRLLPVENTVDAPLRGRRERDRRRELGRARRRPRGRHAAARRGRERDRAGARARAGPRGSTTTRRRAARSAPACASSGISAAVGCPIVVDGRLWGVMVAAQTAPQPLPADTESRVAQFTELIATAISNVQARSDLAASRARIAAASDDERRRVVRDLHDGAQQRLVHTVVTMKLGASRRWRTTRTTAPSLLDEALEQCRAGGGRAARARARDHAGGADPRRAARGRRGARRADARPRRDRRGGRPAPAGASRRPPTSSSPRR